MPTLIITGKALQGCTFIIFFRHDNHLTVFAPSGESFLDRCCERQQKQDVYHIFSKTALFSPTNTFPPDHRIEINEPCDILLPRNLTAEKTQTVILEHGHPKGLIPQHWISQVKICLKIEHIPRSQKTEYVKKEGKYLPRKQLNYYA